LNTAFLTLCMSISSSMLVFWGGSWLIWGNGAFKHLFASLFFASPVFIVFFAFFYWLSDKYVNKYQSLILNIKIKVSDKTDSTYQMLVLNIKNNISKYVCPEKKQKKYLSRYVLYGSSLGAFVGSWNFLFLLDLERDPSGAIIYIFLVYFPSFLVCLPWSLITIFTEGDMLNGTIMAAGAILNGSLIGAAYGALKKSN